MTFITATDADHALAELADHGDELTVLAGGSDLMVQYQARQIDPHGWLHVERISELVGVHANGTRTTIGALTTHGMLVADAHVRAALPALAQAAATVGGWQTQEVGTLAGNVCNASPAADTPPALLVADATVTLRSARGERTLPLPTFVQGRRAIDRRPDELVTSFGVDPLPPRSGEVYLKVGPRRAMEVALVGLAVRLSFDDDERVSDARIAACAVGPVPFRAHAAEAPLVGSVLERDAITAAGSELAAAASPIDDARASADYRLRVLAPLLARAIDHCRRQALGRPA